MEAYTAINKIVTFLSYFSLSCIARLYVSVYEAFISSTLVICLSDAKSRIIDIMNGTISQPRSDARENRPLIEKLEVPILKRSRFLGVGGLNLKKLMAETGKSRANCLTVSMSFTCCW